MKFFSEIITEEDFAKLAEKPAHNMLKYAAYFTGNSNNKLNIKHYMSLVKESMELEDFLDDHGARNNKKWIFLTDISFLILQHFCIFRNPHLLNLSAS